jgi:hypothetical protein
MNVNVKLSLSDDERRRLASCLAGKPVKRLATRADVNQLVRDLLSASMSGAPAPRETAPAPEPGIESPADDDFCSEECCRQNRLLTSRVNVLQHRLDTSQ